MDAFRAGQDAKAEEAARELMQLVDGARAQFGDLLDWRDEGGALWKRAKESTGSDDKAGELTDAIAQHAYRKHWGHTVLGLLACRCGELDTAVSHLNRIGRRHSGLSSVVVTGHRSISFVRFAFAGGGKTDSNTYAVGKRFGTTRGCVEWIAASQRTTSARGRSRVVGGTV